MRYPLIVLCLFAVLRFELPAYADFDTPSRLQLIYDAEDHRLSSAPIFANLGKFSQSGELTAALTALGRIGDPKSVAQVAPFITHRQPSIRITAAYALGSLGGTAAVTALTKAANTELKTDVLGTILSSLGRAGADPELAIFEKNLARLKPDQTAFAEAVEGVGLLLNKNSSAWNVSPTLLVLLAQHAADQDHRGVASAFALTRYKGDMTKFPLSSVLSSFHRAKGPARALLVRVLGRAKSDVALSGILTVRSSAETIGTRVEAARALGNYPESPLAIQELRRFLKDVNAGVRIQALQSISALGSKGAPLQTAVEQAFRQPSISVKSQSIQTLAVIAPIAARPLALKTIKDKNADLVSAGLAALGVLGTSADLVQVVPFIENTSPKLAIAAITALGLTKKENVTTGILKPLREALAKHDLGLTAVIADTAGALDLRALAPDLAASYEELKSPDVEAKLSILAALEKIGSKDQLNTIESALKDDERLVVAVAASTYKTLTGTDVSSKIPATSTIKSDLPSMNAIAQATKTVVALRTTRGLIRIALSGDAPLVAYHFASLVEQGFYNGLTFHRVVPNFVAQGGDPRGDGFGGPGYLIRDQVSAKHHLRGTLGIATAGKDTGGSQFFINLAPNLHLDGLYSVFGSVVSGMDVADKLEGGDKIIEAQIVHNFDVEEFVNPEIRTQEPYDLQNSMFLHGEVREARAPIL